MSALTKAADPELGDITAVEDIAAWWAISSAMYLWENSHYQYNLGFMPEEHWTRIKTGLNLYLRDPYWRPRMVQLAVYMNPSFRAVVEGIADEIDSESE